MPRSQKVSSVRPKKPQTFTIIQIREVDIVQNEHVFDIDIKILCPLENKELDQPAHEHKDPHGHVDAKEAANQVVEHDLE